MNEIGVFDNKSEFLVNILKGQMLLIRKYDINNTQQLT